VTDDRDEGTNDGTNADRASDGGRIDDDEARIDEAPAEVDFADLSLPQRVFVAAVQNPTRGVFVVALLAFAFSFYVAFWMVFPRVAAFLSAMTLGLAAVSLAVYYGLKRL